MRLALLCILPALACASAPTSPPITLETEHGEVRTYSRFTAETVGRMLEHAPEIKERLESTRADAPAVWVLASARAHTNGALAACGPDRIQLGFDALVDLRAILVHELVHWYARQSPFSSLPHFMEEGLADYIALEFSRAANGLDPEFTLTGSFNVSIGEFSMTALEASSLPPEKAVALRELGCFIVSHLGLPLVAQLAAEGVEPVMYMAELERVLSEQAKD